MKKAKLGELAPKPYPLLYAETLRVGLGIPFKKRHHVIGIEDSSAGVVSIWLAGVSAIGLNDGNIIDAGMESLCLHMVDGLGDILKIIFNA